MVYILFIMLRSRKHIVGWMLAGNLRNICCKYNIYQWWLAQHITMLYYVMLECQMACYWPLWRPKPSSSDNQPAFLRKSRVRMRPEGPLMLLGSLCFKGDGTWNLEKIGVSGVEECCDFVIILSWAMDPHNSCTNRSSPSLWLPVHKLPCLANAGYLWKWSFH